MKRDLNLYFPGKFIIRNLHKTAALHTTYLYPSLYLCCEMLLVNTIILIAVYAQRLLN